MPIQYIVCVVRQSSVIACYGPFGDMEAAQEFARVYLGHESNVQIQMNYGTATFDKELNQ